ncbi:MAG: PIN domain-containing protein, partial [Bacteroidales bacterium]|nr:PIN domain-containing protein [Bacteroidales bacterium]
SSLKNIHYVDVYYHFNLIKSDPDDNEFVDCAIAADAKCIVTNDKHFSVLKNKEVWPQIEIKKLWEYCNYLKKH